MKTIGLLFITSLILVGCNKNEKAVNRLTGKWNVTEFIFNNAGESGSTYNDITEESRTITYEFLDCKLKNDEPCVCNWETKDSEGYTTTISYTYTVSDDGKTIDLIASFSEYNETWKIEKLTKKELIMDKTNSNGSTVHEVLEKVD